MRQRHKRLGSWLTDRLRLEPVRPEHGHDLWRLHQDAAVAEWHGGAWSVEQAGRRAVQFGADWAEEGVGNWMA